MKVLCLLASLYSMPSGPAVGKPGAELSARIEAAMTSLRAADSDEASRAVRTLALIGEPALPFVVKRLNEAEAGERLLLLAAVSRIPRAAPLLETAKKDPHLVVRAWVTPPRRAPGRTLAEHAKRYLDILALSEKHKRDDVAEDLRELTPDDLERAPEFFEEEMRERMKDRGLAREIHKRRRKAALEFAEAGARELVPRKGDPIFVAYLALLREENEALHRACTTLVLQGEAVAPHLEALLEKESYEPRVVVGLLRSVRADKGVGLYARIDELRVGVQQLLVSMSREILGPDAESMAAKMAFSEDPAVRVAALDVLLDLPAPAGRIVARKLLDVSRFVQADFSRATKLLVRAGDEEDLKLLVELASTSFASPPSRRPSSL